MQATVATLIDEGNDSLARVAVELVEDWAADGVVIGEARFAPQVHTQQELTIDEAVAAVAEGLRRGQQRYGGTVGLLLCCLRHESVGTAWSVLEAADAAPDVVVGLELAGDETLYSGAAFAPVFAAARAAGLHVTIHAGADSVLEALDLLGAERIGHGGRSTESRTLVERLRLRAALEGDSEAPVEGEKLGAPATRSARARASWSVPRHEGTRNSHRGPAARVSR